MRKEINFPGLGSLNVNVGITEEGEVRSGYLTGLIATMVTITTFSMDNDEKLVTADALDYQAEELAKKDLPDAYVDASIFVLNTTANMIRELCDSIDEFFDVNEDEHRGVIEKYKGIYIRLERYASGEKYYLVEEKDFDSIE